jgi:hypothetical protein
MLFARKSSLKDDLPDLTPYLSKKGGNNPARGGAPAQKADISQKLSALVKKPGTSSVSEYQLSQP